VQTPDLDALLPEQIAEHPAAGKGELHGQLVDPPHDGEIGRRYRLGEVIYAAPADPLLPGLPRRWQRMRTIDHRFTLGNSPAHFSEDWAERP
jgi:hypothetical protein